MIRRNVLRRLEQIEVSLIPKKREVLKIVVASPWGIIQEIELDVGGGRKLRGWPSSTVAVGPQSQVGERSLMLTR